MNNFWLFTYNFIIIANNFHKSLKYRKKDLALRKTQNEFFPQPDYFSKNILFLILKHFSEIT